MAKALLLLAVITLAAHAGVIVLLAVQQVQRARRRRVEAMCERAVALGAISIDEARDLMPWRRNPC